MIGDSLTASILQKALDGTWQRQRAIANNLANYETPGYKAIKVSFEESLNQEIKRLQNNGENIQSIDQGIKAIGSSKIKVFSDYSTSERADGNNVNLDSENIELARNQIQYQYLTRSMTDMYSRLRHAISEGKR